MNESFISLGPRLSMTNDLAAQVLRDRFSDGLFQTGFNYGPVLKGQKITGTDEAQFRLRRMPA
eukprot:6172632-Pleurochrysis_carterae.AAC.2